MSDKVKQAIMEFETAINFKTATVMPMEYSIDIENAKVLLKYIEQLQQENKDLKKQLYSPDQVETTCSKCGEKLYINYSREVYDLKQENHMLKQAVDNTYETSQDIMYEMQEENESLGDTVNKASELLRKKENKIEELNNILTEFEKWLEEEIEKRKDANVLDPIQVGDYYIKIALKTSLDKLQELKGGKK